MNLFTLSLAYVRTRPLQTTLNLLLLALGMGTIVVLLVFREQLEERLTRDQRGIDLVVGAKGSPIQLILSTVYQMDVPTGNITERDATFVRNHPMVASVIPMALGDSFHGFRIVGTTPDYVTHYGAETVEGRLWEAPLEAVVGATVAREAGVGPGDTLVGSHGIGSGAGGGMHSHNPYSVVGVLGPTGTVIDRLVLTSVGTVRLVHEPAGHSADEEDHQAEHDHEAEASGEDSHDAHAHEDEQLPDPDAQVTALLVKYRTPIAAASLPRIINMQSAMQSAAPAYETARLLRMVGIGIDAFRVFAYLLIVTAALSMFVALYTALERRQYDLAIMRTVGAGRGRVLLQILVEGQILALTGTALGLVLGHAVAEGLSIWLSRTQEVPFTGSVWVPQELWLFVVAFCVGSVAALLPALRAYRLDVARVLAHG
ncbi:MAG: multidrug ABC transporter substrate-binding protein [Rhodospirillaceae bacterium]|nr:multidrug ABC transporter substrate-binding protein [Rhodospirillaceae bacterium]